MTIASGIDNIDKIHVVEMMLALPGPGIMSKHRIGFVGMAQRMSSHQCRGLFWIEAKIVLKEFHSFGAISIWIGMDFLIGGAEWVGIIPCTGGHTI